MVIGLKLIPCSACWTYKYGREEINLISSVNVITGSNIKAGALDGGNYYIIICVEVNSGEKERHAMGCVFPTHTSYIYHSQNLDSSASCSPVHVSFVTMHLS